MTARVLQIELPLASDDDLELLRGALLAARATELAEARRRSARHGFGYGTDAQRESMTDEAAQRQRRVDLLDRLAAAIDEASGA